MGERILQGYKRLFEVRILHHYWLDEGGDVFDNLPQEIRNNRLLDYTISNFLSLAPTKTTTQLIQDLQCVLKSTPLGLIIGAPGHIAVPVDATFDFIVKVEHPDFFNYTALTLRKQNIYEIFHTPDEKIYRYKENVFIFSNETGTSKDLYNPVERLYFLSKATPSYAGAVKYPAESLVGSLFQATVDKPAAAPPSSGWQLIANAAKHPIYVHQDDMQTIVPPPGLVGAPQKGIELTADIPDDIFALVRIKTLLPTNAFSLLRTTNPVNPLQPTELRKPVFEIRFKNRSTIWKYYDRRKGKSDTPDNSVFTEPNPLPLTFFGNASAAGPAQRTKASAGMVNVKVDASIPPKITGLVSEIFQ
jgi:hypothetical protein